MAAEAPICDVLSEAMEYLSKLGANLRTRTENLKERKINKDKLKNAHAVQKAVSKVLLICELSKKSLENVEKEVKKIQKRVDYSQAPVNGGKSVSSDEKKYSFQYRSQTLKIATKIPIKHYFSPKVHARKMSIAMQDKYPVYYDCKLYRQRRKMEKKKSENERKPHEITSKKRIEHNNEYDKDKTEDEETIHKSNVSDNVNCDNYDEQNGNKNETNQLHISDAVEVEGVPNKLLEDDSILTEKDSLNDQANSADIEKDSAIKSDQQKCHIKDIHDEIINQSILRHKKKKRPESNQKRTDIVENGDSHTENVQDDKSQEATENNIADLIPSDKSIDIVDKSPPHKKRKLPFVFESESDCDTSPTKTLDSDNEKRNKDTSESKCDGQDITPELNSEDAKKPNMIDLDDTTTKDICESKSNEGPTKPYIKCVNISKLLKPSVNLLSDIPVSEKLSNKHDSNFLLKEKNNKSKLIVQKPSIDNKDNVLNRKSMEDDYWDRKRNEVRNFKPKELKISLCQLPKLTDDLLNLHKIKVITQHGSVVALRNDSDSTKEDNIKNVKKALLNDSDSEDSVNNPSKPDKTQNRKDKASSLALDNNTTNEDKISKENENIKSALLNDSDSDQNKKTNIVSELPKNPENGINQSDGSQKEQDKEHSPTKIKQALLISSEDSDKSEIDKFKQKIKNRLQLHKKRVMQSMKAKKMLLTYSSSSDDEENKKKSDLDAKTHKRKRKKSLISSSESTKHDSDQNSNSKKVSTREIADNNDAENCAKRAEDKGQSAISSDKMVRSKAKPGSSISHNSDTQDINDKDIDRLANLDSLDKPRRRHSTASDNGDGLSRSNTTRKNSTTTTMGEHILKAENSSEVPSADENDSIGAEEEYPPQIPMDLNNGIGHMSKDDLLGESDSSVSNENKHSENSLESEEENVKLKRRKANAISSDSEAGSSRKKNQAGERLSDFEDSEDENSEPGKKSKRKKRGSESDASASSDDGSKKKRRRIKQMNDSDLSDSDGETEGRNKHGRKNIRKVMGKNQLEEATKKAAREEKERIARIAERQKLYNNLEFDESGKPDEVVLEKVVLDFDPDTKEPLIEVDRGLVKKLKPHQANGIKFMWDACFESVKRIKKDKGSGCILAHCMGLGKTLQVISLAHTLLTHGALTGVRRVLVVCPLSTVLNWVNEFRLWLKHAENDFHVDVYELSRHKQNTDRASQLGQWFECGGVCVLGYEMFRNLSADNVKKFRKKMLKIFQESLVDPGPDLVVCDEGHLLKNEKTSLSQSMNRVKTRRRIVLTGTPLQNNLKEYYCMVQFVKPNLLGKYNEYLNRFVNPITNGQYTDSTEHDIRVMKRRSHVLHKMLDGAVQRRDYGVLAPFLPPKHEYVLFITLSEVQVKLYQYYLDNYSRRPLAGKSSGFLFPDFQSLQRIWTHPLVLKYNSERYEIMQQKKREREEDESEGSLVDFIDDDSTPEATSTEESTDELSDMSDDSRKRNKKKKTTKKSKAKDTRVAPRRGTRANPVEQEEEIPELEVVEAKNENPTEWWIKLVTDDELEDMRNSHKLVLLFDILRQCETIGDKLLVFSQSLYSLDLIEHFLGKVDEATQEGRIDEKLGGHVGSWSPGLDYFRLDGSTSCENRSTWCKNFNKEDNPRARLFLISTRAGGLGINLVAANRVVIFDVSWNPSHDVQSIFRVYRFGQKKPCYIYRFLAMGTMEEKIYERQVTKQAISKRVIDEQQIDRHYAENDLAELYKFEPSAPQPRQLPALPKDRLFAEMLREHEAQIYKYHEHDSLLENKEEETLTEEERKAAWEDFENEKNKPPPAPFPTAWPMHNGMVPSLLAQQQHQLAYATVAAMLRKDIPNINENQIRDMLPLIYNSNPGLMQKMSEIYKYAQPSMMNPGMMNPVMNAAGSGMGGTSGLQYEPPWQRQHHQQQQMRLQQLMQQQNHMGAKYYAGGLGSRDPVAMALQQQRAREIMLGGAGAGAAAGAGAGAGRPRGRPPLQPRAPPAAHQDIVNLDSD
ncbi:transcriptional regulator ATRX homolog isoform X1 [Manduca sexta]|uniref:transcriptional regulator ATRX homolog isoform X1 n=3 Tax=Manduca sexta TaxID=7130 RepID=UPI00188FE33E|nr:transcriptional regulator ATRX homolog isoform X1 [Manduca sexta]